MQSVTLEFPYDPEPLNSPFYIARPPLEEQTYQEISRIGSVVRIQAPHKMGKTSLILRLLDYAQQSGFHTVYIDFQLAEEAIFISLDKFLRWFCANTSQQLHLTPMLDNYWDEDVGKKVSCTLYFQNYLLKNINNPLVLVLDKVDQIFEYSSIAQEFFSLLRSWHEQAKHNILWQKLRLVVVHSTEIYTTLNINQSPFNVGLAIQLPEFSLEQIQDLAQRYGLNWTGDVGQKNAQALQAIVGGHPYLVRLAIYHLANSPEKSLEQLLGEATTITGIYSVYLRRKLATLQQNPKLVTAFKQVITADDSVELDCILAYKLEGMGLIKLDGNQYTIACELYRRYFSLQDLKGQTWQEQIEQLQRQVQELQRLSYTDELTQLANRRYFNIYLKQQWQRLADERSPLSIILVEIDYFRIYSSTHGQEAGDKCLCLVADVIREVVNNNSHQGLPVRYKETEFAAILPHTTTGSAFSIAELIRKGVKALALAHDETLYGLPAPVLTVSLAIACTIVHKKDSPSVLVNAASEALEQSSVQNERDRTFISKTFNY
ncbi:MAG: AAA-like domain-containing protein [Iphinoe sp. HA4291-MV1]|nr:AAA-like domain-containing protein [Iphinoe sp. HA4291-MV1]